jgi:hypothetical protein
MSTCAAKSIGRGLEWTLGEGNSVRGRGLAEEWLARRIEAGRLKLQRMPRALGEMSLAHPIGRGGQWTQEKQQWLASALHDTMGKVDDYQGRVGVGEGTATSSASVRSGARCRAAQPAWKGGKQGPRVDWWGSVERWAS